MKFSDLRVKTKLMLGFAAVAAIVLLVSALSLHSLGASNARFSDYLAGVGVRERLAADVHSAATRRAIAARNLVLVTEAKDTELEKAAVLKAHDEVHAVIDKLKAAVAQSADATDRDRALLAEIVRVESLYGPVATDIVGKALAGQKDAAIAKMNNTRRAREVVSEARDLLGGNGILLDFHVMRHMADLEALHTYEGTETIQTLIVGRDITGVGAFA